MILDFNYIVKSKSFEFFFAPASGSAGLGYKTWDKPKGASMIEIICISGGAGGGGGFTRTAGSAGGGGGGGSAGMISRAIIPAIFLPNKLAVLVGRGGAGQVPGGGSGQGGLTSAVYFGNSNSSPMVLCASPVSNGGGPGNAASAGTAGSQPTAPSQDTFNALGFYAVHASAGLGGGAGGIHTGAVGTTITAWAAVPLSGGAGGAGCTAANFNGGGQTATALLDIGSQGYYPTTAGILAPGGVGGTGVDVNGSGGVSRVTPFFNCGGGGGGSNNVGQAGHGGKGGIGCGGGGGGAGATAGRGGDGGGGMILILSW